MPKTPPVWKILLIDDDEEDYLLTRELLSQAHGHKVLLTWAAGFEQGRAALFETAGWDAVLIDYDLGPGTGVELIREAVARGRSEPLILLTGRGNYEVDLEAMQAGASLYLTKTEVNALLLERSIRYAIERKEIENALRESEERYRLVARAANDVVWEWDLRRDQVRWSEALHDRFGYRADLRETSLDWWADRIDPVDRAEIQANIRQVIDQGGDFWGREYRFRRADGSYAEVHDRGWVVRDASGKAVRMVGALRDLTEERAAARTIRASEERFRKLVQVMPAGMYTLDQDGFITYFNERAVELWGRVPQTHSPEDRFSGALALYDARGNLLAKDDSPAARAILSGKSSRSQELQIGRPDGTRVSVSLNVDPLYDEDGRLVGAIGIFEDVTQLKQVESALQVGRTQLETTLARLQKLFSSDVVGIVTGDPGGQILEANDAYLRMVGYTRADLEAGRISWKDLTPPEYLAVDEQAIARVRQTGQAQPYEKEYLRADGSRLWVLISLSIMPGEDSKLVAFVLDISAQKRADQALRESESRYSQLFHNEHTPMLLIDPQTVRIVDANPAAVSFYGWNLAELTSKRITEINTLSENEAVQAMARARASQSSQVFFFRHRLANGEVREVEVHSGPIRVGDQELLFSIVLDLTERGLAEKARESAYQLVSEILESIQDPFYSVDRDWRITYANQPALDFWQRSRSELVGRSLMEAFPGSLGSEIHQRLIAAMDSRQVDHFEAISPFKGHWLDAHIYPTADGGLSVFFSDIDRRVREEQRLRDTLDLNDKILASAELGVMAYEAGGQCILANEAAARLVNATREDLLKQNFRQLNSWKRSGLLALAEDSLASGQPRSSEVHFVTSFGREVYWQATFTPFASGGEQRLLLIVHDVTDLRKGEAALRQSEQRYRQLAEALQNEQSKLSAALSNLPVGVGLASASGQILSLNDAALKMVGLAAQEELPPRLEDFSRLIELHELDGRLVTLEDWPLRRAARGVFDRERELLLRRISSGRDKPVSISVVPVRGRQDTVEQFVFLMQDLSERWAAQQERERGRGQLEAIVDSLAEGVILFDPQGSLLDINPAALSLLGSASIPAKLDRIETLTDRLTFTTLEGQPLPPGQDPIQQVLRGERVENRELVVQDPFGHEWVGVFTGGPIPGANGSPVLSLLTIREATEQSRAHAAMRESEERFRTLFSNMSEGFALGEACLDENGRPVNFQFLEINTAFERQSGLSRSALGRPITEVLPNLEQVWIDTYCGVALSGKPVTFQEFNQDLGRYFDVFCYSPQRGRFAIIFRDITEQKKLEDAQRESNDRLTALFRASPVPLAMNELPSGRYLEVNDAYLELSGFTREELIGRTVLEAGLTRSPRIPASFREMLDELGAVSQFQTEVMLKDGSVRTVLISGTRIELSGKEVILSGVTDIHELKQAQRISQASEERFRTLADNIAQLVWMADEQGELFWYNRRWYEYTGLSEQESIGSGWSQAHHPDYLERVREKYLQQIRAGEVWEDIFPLRGADGEYRWFLSRALPIRDSEGRVLRWFGSNTDITEQLEIENQLKTSEQRFRQLADSMPQLVWTAQPDGTVDYYNRRFQEYGGIAPAQDGQAWEWGPVLHEDDLQPTVDAWTHSIETGQVYQAVHRVRMSDGAYRWHLSRGVPALDEQGRVVKWYGTATDIHENRLAQQALAERGERLALLSDAAQRLLGGGTPEDLLAWLRERMQALLGLDVYIQYQADPDEQILTLATAEGLSFSDRSRLTRISFQDSVCGLAALTRAAVVVENVQADPQPHTALIREMGLTFYISHPLVVADRLVGTLSFGSHSIQFLDGESRQLIGALSDLVALALERHEAQTALQEYARALERSNRDLEEFAYVASHDLQEPLRKVRSFGEHLNRQYSGALDEEGKDYLTRMTHAAGRMQVMIDNLLDYSRIVTRGQDFVPVDLNETLEEVTSDLEIRLRDTRGEVRVEALPAVLGDPPQIQQLLLNLVGNGLKFHRPGVPPLVTVRAETIESDEESGCWVRLTVEDNGIGFDPRFQERVFQPFQRLHGRSEYEGNGIGLAICRKIAERHGGSISAESKPGVGSRFIVRLPAA